MDISEKRDLIQHFNLANYRRAANFGAREWRQQIAKRAMIRMGLAGNPGAQDDELMTELIRNPLAEYPFSEFSGQHVRNKPYATVTVFPLTAGHAKGLLRRHERTGCSDDKDFVEIFSRDQQLGLQHFAYFAVDLGATAQMIRDDFTEVIDQLKKLIKDPIPVGPITQTVFEQWRLEKVLPSFDLMAWSEWADRPMKAEDIALKVYPGDTDVPAEEVHKTLKRSEAIISWRMQAALQKQEGLVRSECDWWDKESDN